MVEYQESSELFCFIASYHSMTTVDDGKLLADNILNVAADFLALGIDPERATFWVQSDVPEVMELAWMLSMHITVSQLQLGHSFKDKTDQGFNPSSGLFFYPVLMAADIVLFGAEKVPVGKDQKQHLEMARDIARRFNAQYGEALKIPEPDILTDVATVPGIDGRKMSKSYNNAIYPFATEKQLKRSIMGIETDSTPVEEAKPYKDTPLFDIYRLFLDEAGIQALIEKFQTPGVGYGHIKQDLLKAVLEYFGPYRERRAEIMQRPDDVRDILSAGAAKARAAAAPYLEAVRSKTGLKY